MDADDVDVKDLILLALKECHDAELLDLIYKLLVSDQSSIRRAGIIPCPFIIPIMAKMSKYVIT